MDYKTCEKKNIENKVDYCENQNQFGLKNTLKKGLFHNVSEN
jgi:hypothetical protein